MDIDSERKSRKTGISSADEKPEREKFLEKQLEEKDATISSLKEQIKLRDQKIIEQKAKIKILQQKVRRRTKKITDMTKIMDDLKDKKLMESSVADQISENFSDLSRDIIMNHQHNFYPQYNFKNNVGYGTKEHQDR